MGEGHDEVNGWGQGQGHGFYAPTNDSSEDDKYQFYYTLKTAVEGVPSHDVLVVMGDLNAQISNKNAGYMEYQQGWFLQSCKGYLKVSGGK